MARQRSQRRYAPGAEKFAAAVRIVSNHPLLAPLAARVSIRREAGETKVPAGQWALVSHNALIRCHPSRRGEVDEWVYALAHCLLHLGLGHLPQQPPRFLPAYNAAADIAVERFLDSVKLGLKPQEYRLDLPEGLPRDFERCIGRSQSRAFRPTCPRTSALTPASTPGACTTTRRCSPRASARRSNPPSPKPPAPWSTSTGSSPAPNRR